MSKQTIHHKTGSLEIQASGGPFAEEFLSKPGLYSKADRYVWRISPDIAALPENFELELLCLTDPDGIRRFVPIGDIETFIARASVSGAALLDYHFGMTREQRQSYRLMRLIFRLRHRLREHFSRAFRIRKDLVIPRRHRALGANVLPEGLGLTSSGVGETWSLQTLIDQGKNASESFGTKDPTYADYIRLGLLEAAYKNPRMLDDSSKCLALVRMGLFNLVSDAGNPTKEEIERVQQRLINALWKHLDNDPDTNGAMALTFNVTDWSVRKQASHARMWCL